MNKIKFLITCVTAVMLFASCDKNESTDDLWRLNNEAQFAKIAANSEYTKLYSESGAGFIMYKELQSGSGDTPYFTDKVKVLYTGWYKNDWSEGDSYKDNQGNTIINKIIFDSTENRNLPYTFTVSNLIDGYRTALQHMQVGDKWEIWIPWKLGYGSSGYSSTGIESYTTLVFEVELVGIVE